MPSKLVVTSENAHAYHQGCPYLGAEDDLEIKFLFASQDSCCHRAKPVEPIALAHQQTYCLTPQFIECPVYKRETIAPLPAELRQPSAPVAGSWNWWIAAVVLLLLGAGLFWLVYGGGLSRLNRQLNTMLGAPTAIAVRQPTATPTSTSTPSATLKPTQTARPSPTAVLPTETFTPMPTETPVIPTTTATKMVSTATATATLSPMLTATPQLVVQAVITATRVNMRNGPSIDYLVLAVVKAGEQFEVIGRLNDESWWQICCTLDGQAGWVFGETVMIEGEVSTIPLVQEIPTPISSDS